MKLTNLPEKWLRNAAKTTDVILYFIYYIIALFSITTSWFLPQPILKTTLSNLTYHLTNCYFKLGIMRLTLHSTLAWLISSSYMQV